MPKRATNGISRPTSACRSRPSTSGSTSRSKRSSPAAILSPSFANAPKARLYGAEFEVQKYFDLSGLGGDKGFFANRRALFIGNYTYTKSKLKVSRERHHAGIRGVVDHRHRLLPRRLAADRPIGPHRQPATRPGTPGPSVAADLAADLCQQPRRQPRPERHPASARRRSKSPACDSISSPARVSSCWARTVELKFEARNITGRKHEEFQHSGANRIDVNTYKLGTTLALSASLKL